MAVYLFIMLGMCAVADPWVRTDVSEWQVAHFEPLGSEAATWLTDEKGQRWLHKSVRYQTNHIDGEDWAEVAATQVGQFLGVPCADTRLCTREGKNGSLSRQIHDSNRQDFREGGLWLNDYPGVEVVDREEDYPAKGIKTIKRHHTLENIREALVDVEPPESFIGPQELTAFDVFAGYTCLDALVVNRDRHEQNWAVLEPLLADGSPRLAPSFDHGSAFAYNYLPAKRAQWVNDEATRLNWLRKGTAHRFEHPKPPGPATLVQVAKKALSLATQDGRTHWQQIFTEFNLEDLKERLSEGTEAIKST